MAVLYVNDKDEPTGFEIEPCECGGMMAASVEWKAGEPLDLERDWPPAKCQRCGKTQPTTVERNE